MRPNLTLAGLVSAVMLALTPAAAICAGGDPYLRPAKAPEPAHNKSTPARVALGKALFFDPRLSGSDWISCASCHNPALGWSDALPTGIGDGMKRLTRNTPTIVNVGFATQLMWDGRAPNLEEQALGPIAAGEEMNQDIPGLVKKLSQLDGYVTLFEKAYPGEGINDKTIGKALAAYQRTVVSTESPFDRWRKGDPKAVSASAKRGFDLFTGKANCATCHEGFNFTDNGFHNIGLKPAGNTADLGRFGQRKVISMRGAFKTPTLRDIALTAPYMHNGMYRTLEEVVEHYDRGGDVQDNLSPEMKPLNLTEQEKADLVAFMKTLTGKPMQVVLPQLPN
jgi:cytochrome c peroxidase